MPLIVEYLSPFVRRVAVVLNLYGHSYEHGPWSAFSDGEVLGRHNPFRPKPALALDNGKYLFKCAATLDHLGELAAPNSRIVTTSGVPPCGPLHWPAAGATR